MNSKECICKTIKHSNTCEPTSQLEVGYLKVNFNTMVNNPNLMNSSHKTTFRIFLTSVFTFL